MISNKFFILVSSEKDSIFVRKLTKDKQQYYEVPESLNDPNKHPLLIANSYFSSFKEDISKKQSTDKSYFRHIVFSIKDSKGAITPAAKAYMNDKGEFVLENQVLDLSPGYLDNVNKSADDTNSKRLSVEEILKTCGM